MHDFPGAWDVRAHIGFSFQGIEVTAVMIIRGIMGPDGGLTGLMISIKPVRFIIGGETEADGVDGQRARRNGRWIIAPATDFETIAVASCLLSILERPAMIEGHRTFTVDAIETVIAISPGTAGPKDIARAIGVAAETVGISAGACFGDTVPIFKRITVQHKIAGSVASDGETHPQVMIEFDLFKRVVAAFDAKALGAGMRRDRHLNAGHFNTLERAIGRRNKKTGDTQSGRFDRGKIENRVLSGHSEVFDTAFVDVMDKGVEAVFSRNLGGSDIISPAVNKHRVAGRSGRLSLGDTLKGRRLGAGVAIRAGRREEECSGRETTREKASQRRGQKGSSN